MIIFNLCLILSHPHQQFLQKTKLFTSLSAIPILLATIRQTKDGKQACLGIIEFDFEMGYFWVQK